MRRRQEAVNDTTNNGVTILESPDLPVDENKYGLRQRKRHRYRSFVQCAVLAVVVPAIELLLFKVPFHLPTSLTAVHDVGANVDRNNQQPMDSPRRIVSAAADKKNATANMLPSTPPRIPRRLIFTYKYNLIDPSVNDPPFNAQDPLTANVLNTIATYQKYWDAVDAAGGPQEKNATEKMVVSFLSDNRCLEVIRQSETKLVKHFNDETRGEFKADICRVAELYLFGGYYFDIDIGVVEPLNFDALDIPGEHSSFGKSLPVYQLKLLSRKQVNAPSKDDIVTFASVFNEQGRFFQAFTATMPGHPVLKLSLEYMVGYYEENLEQILPQFIIDSHKSQNHPIASRKNERGMGVGPYTLSLAHQASTDEDWEEFAKRIKKNHGFSNEHESKEKKMPAKGRYARFLYEISLQNKHLKELGYFLDVPLQDAEYKKKNRWCNFVCFGGSTVYFYSRVPGSKGCPLEKK